MGRVTWFGSCFFAVTESCGGSLRNTEITQKFLAGEIFIFRCAVELRCCGGSFLKCEGRLSKQQELRLLGYLVFCMPSTRTERTKIISRIHSDPYGLPCPFPPKVSQPLA
ncbi:unnamed protein product, partial [Choristocarpus tenellus]